MPTGGSSHELRVAGFAAAGLSALALALWAMAGFGEAGLAAPLRVSARVAAFLFAAALFGFAVPSLKAAQPRLALAFLASHVVHLGLIFARAALSQRPQMLRDPIGITAYFGTMLIGAHAAARCLGWPISRAARAAVGLSYAVVWLTFVGLYARNYGRGVDAGWAGVFTAILLVTAALAQLARWRPEGKTSAPI